MICSFAHTGDSEDCGECQELKARKGSGAASPHVMDDE